MSPRGRRPAGSPDTRKAILAAARTAFARDGYQTSLRGIARDAGVDPALVHHYFPDRATLFAKAVIESTAGVDANLMHRAAAITELEPEQLGEGIVRAFITLWDKAGADRFTGPLADRHPFLPRPAPAARPAHRQPDHRARPGPLGRPHGPHRQPRC